MALILLVGLLLSAPPAFYSATQRIGPDFNTFDDSWQFELISRLGCRELSGRDFLFARGPLCQFLHGLGWVLGPGDLASLMRFQQLPGQILATLAVWVLLGLTGAPLAWRASTFLAWVTFIEHTLKPVAGLLAVAACGHFLAFIPEGAEKPQRRVTAWLLAAIPGPVLLLFSFEFGLFTFFSTLAFVLVMVGCTFRVPVALARKVRREALFLGVAALLGAVIFAVAFSLMPAWRRFIPENLELASGHTVAFAVGFGEGDPLGLWQWLAHVLCALAVLVLAIFRWRSALRTGQPLERHGLLIAASCFALVWSRYALTRSDWAHVWHGTVPILFLCACLLPCYLKVEGLRYARPALAVGLLLVARSLFAAPTEIPFQLLGRLLAFTDFEFRKAKLEVDHYQVREAAAAALRLEGDSLYVWPYESIVNLLSGKRNPAYTVQSYSAYTERLERATIERLEAVPDLPALLFTNTWATDGVEHLTRTPLIFRYLLERYELRAPPRDGFVLLNRSAAPRLWKEETILEQPQRFSPGHGESLRWDLPPGRCSASDLLLFRLRASKTSSLGLFKPGKLLARLRLSNGELQERKLLLPPDGQPHEVLLSASKLSDPLFVSVFSPARTWRAQEFIAQLEIVWEPLDWFSRRPREIALEQISVLRQAGVEILKSPLAEQARPELWDAAFGIEGLKD